MAVSQTIIVFPYCSLILGPLVFHRTLTIITTTVTLSVEAPFSPPLTARSAAFLDIRSVTSGIDLLLHPPPCAFHGYRSFLPQRPLLYHPSVHGEQ